MRSAGKTAAAFIYVLAWEGRREGRATGPGGKQWGELSRGGGAEAGS